MIGDPIMRYSIPETHRPSIVSRGPAFAARGRAALNCSITAKPQEEVKAFHMNAGMAKGSVHLLH